MNVFAKFDEILSRILQDIKKKKTLQTQKRFGLSDTRSDNVKTVYPPTNTVCGGYNHSLNQILKLHVEAVIESEA